MFIGHYSAALAAKAADPRIPLGALFVAAQLVDIAWAVFSLTGIEHVELVPGFTATNDLDLQYVPYTHSLAATFGWAVAAWLFWTIGRNWRGWGGSAALVGLVVLSHWFLDLPVHTPDLPLYGDEHKVGFGLWNHPWATLALEGGLFFVTLALYYRATHRAQSGGSWGMFVFAVGIFGIQVAAAFGPRPETMTEMAAVGLASYIAMAIAAEYFDRKRAG